MGRESAQRSITSVMTRNENFKILIESRVDSERGINVHALRER